MLKDLRDRKREEFGPKDEKLKRLPDETVLYPGHLYSADASGTLGAEKQSNPFLRVASLDQFLLFMGA